MKEVTVVNRNPQSYTAHHVGIEYVFNPNEKVVVPLGAAVHIFGFNQADKQPALIRAGVANHPDGKKWMANFLLEMVEYVRKDEDVDSEGLKAELDEKDKQIEALKAELAEALAMIEKLSSKKSKNAKDSE